MLRLTWLGHSTVVIDLDRVRLIADPLLRGGVGPLRRRGPVPPSLSWTGVDAVLLSHLHHDHAHLRSLRMLADVPVLTAAPNARWLRRRGVGGAVGVDQGGDYSVGGKVKVRLTRAVHGHRPMPHRPSAANGHLVQSSNHTVWVVGDTELYPQMSQLPALAGGAIDLVVVPVGGWAPRLSSGHLGPVQAAQACSMVKGRWAIPVHWGTLHLPGLSDIPTGWMSRPGLKFMETVPEHAPDCQAVLLEPGESWTLP